ncbi:hypothetical protein [Rhizobium mayense]|uniref:Uncharacterized protein n=1 Tax=Rhizobium mayense TaxID=1312184 RepID=A0ABT7K3S7_9HYPH|nr:hypothetical protein [Rhizobium mayense]MDL2403252.1 hypothetical protein [Rhizobium mayense]
MAIWRSQSVQFVWFLTSVENIHAATIFQKVAGQSPDSSQQNRVPSPSNPFLSLASGVAYNRELRVQVQPGRVDIFVMPVDTSDPAPEIPFIDTALEVNTLVEAITTNDIVWPTAIRQAIVANLFEPAESQAEASKLFFERAGLSSFVPETSDEVFQINRRKKLTSAPETLNRLLRFGIATFQEYIVQVQPNAGPAGPAVPMSETKFATSLILDLNTVVTGRPIATEHQIPIFKEMAFELLRIANIASPQALTDEENELPNR